MIYCVISPALADELHGVACALYRGDPSIEVIVERRRRERRAVHGDRRSAAGSVARERRRIRGEGGRRAGERRAPQAPVDMPALAAVARPYADRLVFVERVALTGREEEDLDTARLVTRIQAGEADAFKDLYLRYFDRVYGYLSVALQDAHEAEDGAQQVFLKVLEALPRYERRGQPFRAWLFRIVRNTAVDHRRKHGATEPTAPEELDRRREAAEPEAGAWVPGWLSDPEVVRIVERLPPLQRQVVVLRYMLDLTGVEIAAVLGRSPEAVRQLLRRALRRLEVHLAALGREPTGPASALPPADGPGPGARPGIGGPAGPI